MKLMTPIQTVSRSFLEMLKKGFNEFLTSCITFVDENSESYHRVVYDLLVSNSYPFQIDIGSIRRFIMDAANDVERIEFQLKIGDGESWSGNNIKFPFTSLKPGWPAFGSPEYMKYLSWRNSLEFECETEYWNLPVNGKRYEMVEAINIFNDVIIEPDLLGKYRDSIYFRLDKNAWYQCLDFFFKEMFAEFPLSTNYSSANIKRFLKRLDNGCLFGFEFDTTEINYELKKGTPTLPIALNLILILPSFDKKLKPESYYREGLDSILYLGILGNPFFYEPSYPTSGYSAVLSNRAAEAGHPYRLEIIVREDGKFQIIHPREYADKMKRHAFFYLDLLFQTSRGYLSYIETAILASWRK